MKKVRFGLIFAFVILSAALSVKAQSQTSPFAGDWVLDREKTNITKDFPQKLKNYKMSVSGTDSNLLVKSEIDGKVEINEAGQGARTPVTESASRSGNREVPGSSGSSLTTGKLNYGGTMALYFSVNNASYNLNGEEVKIESPQGLVRVKAKPDKSGKSVQFTIIRRIRMKTGEEELITRETWKLSEDGKTLRVHKTAEMPNVRDELTMFLSRVA